MPSTITDQVSGAQSSLAIKAPCRVGTAGNITLAALQTIDDVALAEGDRVLVSAQTNAVENGVYIASATPWVRAPDFAGTNDVVQGTQVRVMQGTSAFGLYYLSTANPVVGTTTLTFLLDTTTASAAAAYAAVAVAAAAQAQAFAAAAGGNAPINSQIHGAVEKTTLADADEFGEADSEATYAVKRITWLSIKTALQALFLSLTGGTLTGALVINKNAGAAPAAPSSATGLQLSSADASSIGATFDAVASNGFLNGRRVNNTRASPAALVNNDIIMRVGALGMSDALGTAARAAVDLLASETWTATANGTKLSFKATPAGSTVLTEVMTINGAGQVTVNGAAFGAVSQQAFTASGTWTKPGTGTLALIETWGAGGSGAKAGAASPSAGVGSGGGGGGYQFRWVLLSALGATETVTIGAGGTGVTAIGNGHDGGDTTFGAWVTGKGGGMGISQLGLPALGGAAGAAVAGNSNPNLDGGSGGQLPTTVSGAGGNSYHGGAGGGSQSNSGSGYTAPGAGGTSVIGGNGSAALTSSGTTTAGGVRGGGSGACGSGATGTGAGGRGECVVTVF